MAVPSEESSQTCTNCDKQIPAQNIYLHVTHCTRNFEKCNFCRKMVSKGHEHRHFMNTRGPNVVITQRERGVKRRDPSAHAWSQKQLLSAVAIAGVVFLGSFFFQRKEDT